MSSSNQKEWAAVESDKKLLTRDAREEVEAALREYGIGESSVEVVALPKTHNSIFV